MPSEKNLAQLVSDLKKANLELREARRAALNLMEDAIAAKEALGKSEERLRITLETAVDFAIINTDTKGIVEGWNSGAERVFGYTAEEIMGRSADIIFTAEDQAAGAPEKERIAAREKGSAIDERWHRRKGDSRLYVSGVMRPVYNPNLVGYVKIARDMTQQKLLEQQKDDFIAVASHELKTPVTSIKAYTELIEEMCSEGDYVSGSGLVKKLDAQVDRLTDLIHSLLDTTKLSEGQLKFNFFEFDINALIKECAEFLQHTTEKHRIILNVSEALIITADRDRIGQVLINLISNAIKYSPKGGDIIVTSTQVNNGAEVSVQDEGIGIPHASLDKVFERFYRVGNSQIETFPGMGLGLYITASIIQQHGGKIWVKNNAEKGSTFCFYLPNNKNEN